MRTRFAAGENPFLVRFRQSDVAMSVTMNVHEHCSADEKGVLMDTGILMLGDAGQTEDPPAQLLMKTLGFHSGNYFRISSFHRK